MNALTIGLSTLALAIALNVSANTENKDAAAPETAKKVSYKEAKEHCLKDNAKLAGRDLHKCIKNAEHKTM